MSLAPSIERFLAAFLGLDADGALGRAVTAAMRREGITDPGAYEKLCLSSPDARQRLIDAVTVGETWFFRDRGPFVHLGRHARELCQDGRLNILSAPCSSGEEPYSIAMTLLAAGLPSAAFCVDAVDASAAALEKASRACYGRGSFRGYLPEEVMPYFRETAHGRQVVTEAVQNIHFYQDNLVEPKSLKGKGPYGIIFCRNLLIYLTPDARRQVFRKLDGLLRPGGLLFTGHTEMTFWHQQGYIPMKWERAFALAKPASRTQAKAGSLKPTAPADVGCRATKIPTHAGPKAGISPSGGKTEAPASAVSKALPDQLQQARQLADRGAMDEALGLCRERLRTDGPHADIYCLMGVIQMSQRDLPGAEGYFNKALYLDPGHYESLIHLCLICRQKGDKSKAALFLERAERLAKRDEKNKTTVRNHG